MLCHVFHSPETFRKTPVKYCQLFHCLSHVDVATLSVIDNKKMQQHPDRLTQLSQQIHAVCTRVTGREAATKRKERLLEVLEQNAAAADDEDHFRSVMVMIREREKGKNVELCYTAVPPPSCYAIESELSE